MAQSRPRRYVERQEIEGGGEGDGAPREHGGAPEGQQRRNGAPRRGATAHAAATTTGLVTTFAAVGLVLCHATARGGGGGGGLDAAEGSWPGLLWGSGRRDGLPGEDHGKAVQADPGLKAPRFQSLIAKRTQQWFQLEPWFV